MKNDKIPGQRIRSTVPIKSIQMNILNSIDILEAIGYQVWKKKTI